MDDAYRRICPAFHNDILLLFRPKILPNSQSGIFTQNPVKLLLLSRINI